MESKKVQRRDFKYMGIPNICFSVTKPDDDREVKFKKQRLERGFDGSELWSLDITIAKFILPRLKAYREIACETIKKFPSNKVFFRRIDESIKSFEMVINGEISDENYKIYEKGMRSFALNFSSLWW